MVEQVKSVDYISRRIRFFERAECEGLNEKSRGQPA